MKKYILISILLFSVFTTIKSQTDYTKFVDPFIGTAGHGHTYPGAALPFGMVQLSPDTGVDGWDWCSGYHASDNSILGFSHTHLSGTGASDYGDILFIPVTGDVNFNPGSKENPDDGYRSRFKAESEKASPGYYSVLLDDYNIEVELTSTERCGFHNYSFPETENANIIIDLFHGVHDQAIESYFKIIDNNKIEGYRRSKGWASNHTIYFYAEFSEEISNYQISLDNNLISEKEATGQIVKASLNFDTKTTRNVLLKVGISHVSLEGAKKNLKTELPHWNFNKVKSDAKSKWNKLLSRIEVDGGTEDQKLTFYTALYHSFLAPNLFSDVDHKYMGVDGEVKIAENFNMYTVFSLWDTFRALHPLLTILDEDLTTDLIKSLVAKFDESDVLPVWELAANETWTMIGYHSIPVIVDAFMKGIKNYDIEKAYQAMKSSAMEDDRGLEYYKAMGFIPMDKSHDAVSSTLEYAYDDWCITQMAKSLNKKDDYNYFMLRAKNYLNVFDDETKFMRGRINSGFWKKDFDPAEPSLLGSGEFTEGNSWQYTWFVPQDIRGLINKIGGDELFAEKLDLLFNVEVDESKYNMPSDVTGLIGQYAHGNEPSHHVSYLFNYSGHPWKTQFYTRKIMDEFYTSKRDGLCGNEDCGQMSAWYVFSAMGFYPVVPGSNEYAIGSPIFDKVKIHLNNGEDFTIEANSNSANNMYVSSAKLNGEAYQNTYFTHDDILSGSKIEYEMSGESNKEFGVDKSNRPHSEISDQFGANVYKKNFVPIINPYKTLFANSIKVELEAFNPNSEIRYTLDGTEPSGESTLYTKPIVAEKSFTIKSKVFGNKLNPSEIIEKTYLRTIVRDEENPFYKNGGVIYPTILNNDQYHSAYSAGGKDGLIDGNEGSMDFRDGYWQGFELNDCNIVIDFGKNIDVNKISANFLQSQGSWIFFPTEISISFSDDAETFSSPIVVGENPLSENMEPELKTFEKEFTNVSTRYIKFDAKNIGVCPSFHKAAGGKAWIFIDEIIIE